MANKPLRSQLNQIRAWVRQGRTDAWIAHQLEVSTAELREFRRRHDLSAESEADADLDLRDEIEAEIEATMAEEDNGEETDELEEEGEAVTAAPLAGEDEGAEGEEGEAVTAAPLAGEDEGAEGEEAEEGAGRRRRRRRRGGRGRSRRSGAAMEATFDHGEEGYGLWLDPAVADDPVYAEHWAGHREVEVTIEPERIVIRRPD
jgi:hypothetical protein